MTELFPGTINQLRKLSVRKPMQFRITDIEFDFEDPDDTFFTLQFAGCPTPCGTKGDTPFHRASSHPVVVQALVTLSMILMISDDDHDF